MSQDRQNLIDDLGRDARVLKQGMKLPMTTLTDDHVSAIRSDYMKYTSRHGVFDAQVARELGVAASTLSQFRGDSYKGDNDKIARMHNDWMEQHARKVQRRLPTDYVSTVVAEEMRTVVDVACSTSSLAALVAPSGSGKTMVLKVLTEKYRGRYLYATEDLTPRAFLLKLARICETTLRHQTKAALLDGLVEKLKGTHRPIFVDEAHRLPKDVLPRIRAIHDQAGVPFILAGTHEMLIHINDRSDGRGQLASRCLQYNVLEHVMNAENPDGSGKVGRPLFTSEEVAQFLDNLQVKFYPEAFKLAWAIACLPNHGCLRTVRRVILLLRPEAADRAEAITRQEITIALSLLFGQQGQLIGRWAEQHVEMAEAA